MDEDTKQQIESGIYQVGIVALAAAVGEPGDDGISDDIRRLLRKLANSENLGDLTDLAAGIRDELKKQKVIR